MTVKTAVVTKIYRLRNVSASGLTSLSNLDSSASGRIKATLGTRMTTTVELPDAGRPLQIISISSTGFDPTWSRSNQPHPFIEKQNHGAGVRAPDQVTGGDLNLSTANLLMDKISMPSDMAAGQVKMCCCRSGDQESRVTTICRALTPKELPSEHLMKSSSSPVGVLE